ncbi:L-fuconolactonase [Nakamurella sp. UYEF19]|uniref:amidohydrolase family protein n=1 Tax=Nakamurella sp. UYEF19 TaxID=1756392 RepID=UPI003393A0A9
MSTDPKATDPRPLRIDSHHHLWDLAVRDQAWTVNLPGIHRSFSLDDLRPALVRKQIDGTVLVQTVAVAAETPEFLAIAHADPAVLGVVGWVDLTGVDVAGRLAELDDPLLVGIRALAQDEPDPGWLCRPDVIRGVAAVGAAGLVYDLLVRHTQLPAAIELVRALPEVSFVLDHAGKPAISEGSWHPWAEGIEVLAGHQNVVVKLSGLVTETGGDPSARAISPYSDHLLRSFGPSRLMFGSDWPVCLLAASYDEVVELTDVLTGQLSPSERAEVFGGTADRWYGLLRSGSDSLPA